ncbi:MAG: hypothetical protein ABR545_00460 [Cyclonatronaceae bacterium]
MEKLAEKPPVISVYILLNVHSHIRQSFDETRIRIWEMSAYGTGQEGAG